MPLSAVAARRAQQKRLEQKVDAPASSNAPNSSRKRPKIENSDQVSEPEPQTAGKLAPVELDLESESDISEDFESSESDLEPDLELEPAPTVALARQLSSQKKFAREDGQSVYIELEQDEYFTIVGSYDICVQKGVIEILGATIAAGHESHRVFAPTTHTLPTIRHVHNPFGPEKQSAYIRLMSAEAGIRMLRQLNPSFERIWNKGLDEKRHFSVVNDTNDDPIGRQLRAFESAAWKDLVSRHLSTREAPRVLVAGPKGAGKSSFSRYLLNALLTASRLSHNNGVAYLDLDPGQPEFSPLGEIGLYRVSQYNLGPAFTHPYGTPKIRAHYFGHLSPKENVEHYTECARDLVEYYEKELLGQGCPLVVNSSGWISGYGLDLVESLVDICPVSDVIYMSKEGPEEVIEMFQGACSQKGCAFLTLASNTMGSPRTSSELRSMQMMSYFHLKPGEYPLCWDYRPIYQKIPHIWKYTGHDRFIAGILVLGADIKPDYLETIINGMVVGILAVDEADFEKMGDALGYESQIQADQSQPEDMRIQIAKYGLPYLRNGDGINVPPKPGRFEFIGHALIRAISLKERFIAALTALPPEMLEDLRKSNKRLVLVKGNVDSPGWAYTEDFYHQNVVNPCPLDAESWAKKAPWIEVVSRGDAEQQRKYRTWRTRRNLQTGDGTKDI